MKRKSIVLALCMMLLIVLAGCGKEVAEENPTPPTSEVVSEVISEEVSETTTEEVSEVVSEEPSEVLSEEVSEPASKEPEIVDGVQMVYYETYEEFIPFFDTVEEPVVAIYYFAYPEKGQAILYDGAHYTAEKDFLIAIQSAREIENVTSTVGSVQITNYEHGGSQEWGLSLYATGTDIEVPLTIIYEDGTEETITVYITKTWKYIWEE